MLLLCDLWVVDTVEPNLKSELEMNSKWNTTHAARAHCKPRVFTTVADRPTNHQAVPRNGVAGFTSISGFTLHVMLRQKNRWWEIRSHICEEAPERSFRIPSPFHDSPSSPLRFLKWRAPISEACRFRVRFRVQASIAFLRSDPTISISARKATADFQNWNRTLHFDFRSWTVVSQAEMKSNPVFQFHFSISETSRKM